MTKNAFPNLPKPPWAAGALRHFADVLAALPLYADALVARGIAPGGGLGQRNFLSLRFGAAGAPSLTCYGRNAAFPPGSPRAMINGQDPRALGSAHENLLIAEKAHKTMTAMAAFADAIRAGCPLLGAQPSTFLFSLDIGRAFGADDETPWTPQFAFFRPAGTMAYKNASSCKTDMAWRLKLLSALPAAHDPSQTARYLIKEEGHAWHAARPEEALILQAATARATAKEAVGNLANAHATPVWRAESPAETAAGLNRLLAGSAP